MTQVTHIILLSNSTVLECYELIKALILFQQYYIPVKSSSSQSKGVTLTGDLQAPCSLAVFVGQVSFKSNQIIKVLASCLKNHL